MKRVGRLAISLVAAATFGCGGAGGNTGGGGASSSTTSAASGGSGGQAGTGGATPLPPCANGVKDGAETDVDCGGDTCAPCADDKACGAPSDCQSLACVGSVCAAASCDDEIENGGESDVDCGGPACPACADGKACAAGLDCASGVCAKGVCAAASCFDGIASEGETDVDCGGASCPKCAEGKVCDAEGDCLSGICDGGVCGGACDDGIRDQDESDVDCGGSCAPCEDKRACGLPADCASGVCQSGYCAPATCLDGVRNELETDVDCGGDCAPCGDAKACLAPSDCWSSVCSGGACAVATCHDQVQNQNETAVDCGGSCPPCAAGEACSFGSDCVSKICAGHVCATPSCGDGVENQGETSIDCGGSCAPCADNLGCAVGADCVSKVCSGGACAPPTCNDQAQNQAETDVDCGGPCATKCAIGKLCSAPSDCAQGGCIQGRCQFPVVAISANQHVCVVRSNGALKCWGRNDFGQLGLGDTATRGSSPSQMGDNLPTVNLGTGRTVVKVATGTETTCAILDDGSLKCWGRNGQGQLGRGDVASRGGVASDMGDNLPAVDLGAGRTAVSVAVGQRHVCAILDDGSLKCWGANDAGQLGLGDKSNRGDQPSEMGDNLPPVNLGTGRTAVEVTVTWNDTCARLDNGSVKCFGQGNNKGGLPGDMGDALAPMALGTVSNVQALRGGATHTCAHFGNGLVKCWGYNQDGRLGLGDNTNRTGYEGDALPFVSLGAGRTAKALVSQANSACAILDDDSTKCWGLNSHGSLGLGDTSVRGLAASQMGDNLPPVSLGAGRHAVMLAGGFFGACAVLDNGAVKCWGENGNSTLGLGDNQDRGDQPNEMGDNLPFVSF